MAARTPPNYVVARPASGMGWLTGALQLLRDQAGRLLLIALLMQLILGLVQLPLLGVLVVLAVPGLSAGILEAFHRARIGATPALSLLFRPLASDRLGRFVGMGGLVILISVLCVSFVMGSTTELDEALLARLQQGDMAALEDIDPSFVTRLFAAFAISVAISGTLTFFSIPLVWFGNRKLGAALGEGLRALLANWKPMLVLGLALTAVFVPFSMLTALLMQFALMEGIAGMLGMGLVMVLLLMFQLLLFGTQYCAFAEIFSLQAGPPGAEPPPGDDQLVA
jgi:hypothetical protein